MIRFIFVVGSDVIEHVHEQLEVMREAHRVLVSGGALFLATRNRWSLTPEPHVNLWGVGFLPKPWRALYVRLARKSSVSKYQPAQLVRNTPTRCANTIRSVAHCGSHFTV